MNRRTVQTIARQLADLAADAGADRPDADLLGRFVAARDQAAFAALVRRHGPMVWASCRHLLPNPADAEDAFQATFLALAQQAKRVRNTAALGGWLHGVAVRASLKVRRSEARRRGRERTSAGPEAGRPVPDSAWDGLLTAVHEEVEHLPAALRTAFVLCDLEGVPQPAAAARLGWKPGTLTGRLARARQHLMARLTSRGLAPAVAAGGIGTAATGAAVPPALNQTVLMLAGDPVRASAAVTVLVTEVTSMTLTKVKLLAAGLMVAGGLGLGGGAWRTANVTAQAPASDPLAKTEPPAAPKPAPAPKAKPALVEKPAKAGGWTTWEYRYAGLPDDPMQFVTLLDQLGADGWEYVGVYDHMQAFAGDDARRRQVQARNSGVLDDLAKKYPAKFHDASRGMYGAGALVFKRPKNPPQVAAVKGAMAAAGVAVAGQTPGVEVELDFPIYERRLLTAPPAAAAPGKPSTSPLAASGQPSLDPFRMTEDQVRENMRRYDRDGDGRISAEEGGRSDRMKDRFAALDRNRDGFLDLDEYRGYLVVRTIELAADETSPAASSFAPTLTAVSKPRTPAPEPIIVTVKNIALTDASSLVQLCLEDVKEMRVQTVATTNTLVLFNVPPAAAGRVTELLKRVDVAPTPTEERPVTTLGLPGAVGGQPRGRNPFSGKPAPPVKPVPPPVIESTLEPLPPPAPR